MLAAAKPYLNPEESAEDGRCWDMVELNTLTVSFKVWFSSVH